MFYLLKVERDPIWHYETYASNPSIGNGFELVKSDNIQEAVWNRRCEIASGEDREVTTTCESCNSTFDYISLECPDCGSDDVTVEDMDWYEHVENNAFYVLVKYDPANHVHALHKGWEDERPEHALAQKKHDEEVRLRAIERYQRQIEQYTAKLIKIKEAMDTAKTKLKELQDAATSDTE